MFCFNIWLDIKLCFPSKRILFVPLYNLILFSNIYRAACAFWYDSTNQMATGRWTRIVTKMWRVFLGECIESIRFTCKVHVKWQKYSPIQFPKLCTKRICRRKNSNETTAPKFKIDVRRGSRNFRRGGGVQPSGKKLISKKKKKKKNDKWRGRSRQYLFCISTVEL